MDIETKESNDTYIYLIQMGYWVKIGFTNDIKKRMHSIERTFLPYVLSLVAKKKCNHRPRTFETMLHDEYRDHRKHGEWFLLGKDNVCKLVKKHSFEWCNDYIMYNVEKEFKFYGDMLKDQKKYDIPFNESDIIDIPVSNTDKDNISERHISTSSLTNLGNMTMMLGLLYIPTVITILILLIRSW